jgi:cell division protein FtsI (penicillin-binding protein 3)
VPGYRVAGKTGTAQKIDPRTGAYSSSQLVGSFVGYVPAENPRLAIVVVIDEPRVEAWGGVVAGPVFRRIAEQVLPHLGVSPQEPVKLALASVGGHASSE